MDFVGNRRFIWVVGTTVLTALGLTLGSAALADNADAKGCAVSSTGAQASGGVCFSLPGG
jgi:hypothetical protein